MTVSPRIMRLARNAVPRALRPHARAVAESRGWVQPRSPDEDPFQYPYWEILIHHGFVYPHYLWGTMCAAGLAAALGCPRTTVIEFGVAGGNGLLELERIARWVERRASVEIDVIGFDTGSGLPKPQDYRDLPNLWDEGYYGMDPDRLRAQLQRARLLLGPVSETVPEFMAGNPAPVGFVSFDLDLYSSTRDALAVFRAGHELTLPRVTCYFDDIIGFSHNDYAGERLAIAEFNTESELRKISKLYGLRYVLDQDKWWTDMMYMYHCFEHPSYNEDDGTNRLRDLPLWER